MTLYINEILDVISRQVGFIKLSLEDNFKVKFGYDHLDMRDIVYYLQAELDLDGGELWYEEDLIAKYPTIKDLVEFYEQEHTVKY